MFRLYTSSLSTTGQFQSPLRSLTLNIWNSQQSELKTPSGQETSSEPCIETYICFQLPWAGRWRIIITIMTVTFMDIVILYSLFWVSYESFGKLGLVVDSEADLTDNLIIQILLRVNVNEWSWCSCQYMLITKEPRESAVLTLIQFLVHSRVSAARWWHRRAMDKHKTQNYSRDGNRTFLFHQAGWCR